MKQIIIFLICLASGCEAVMAQSPVNPIAQNTNKTYLEPSTGLIWGSVGNGPTLKWYQWIDSVTLFTKTHTWYGAQNYSAQININNSALAVLNGTGPSIYLTNSGLKVGTTNNLTHNYTGYNNGYLSLDNGSLFLQTLQYRNGTVANLDQIPSSLPPSGAAGGDLTGAYPNPTIKSSVALSGNPTAVTQAATTSNTTIATTAFVSTATANIIGTTTLAGLRALTTHVTNGVYRITDYGGGTWVYNLKSGTLPTDNTGTVVVSTDGLGYFTRVWDNYTVNALWFGAKGDGTTNDRPAVELAANYCISLLASQNVTLYLPNGAYFFNSPYSPSPPYIVDGSGHQVPAYLGLALPVNTTHYLTVNGDGAGSTVIKLSVNCVNAFWINKQADYDTFRNYTFQNLTIDANNMPINSSNHLLIGNLPYTTPGYYSQTRLNVENITVQNGTTINAGIDPTSTYAQGTVIFSMDHPNSGESTQTHCTNVNISNWAQYGGGQGFIVCSNRWTSSFWTNCYYNNINFTNLQHIIANVPSTGAPQSSFYIGGSGFGDNCSIVGCTSQNIGDDAIELGMMSNVTVKDINIINPNNEAILVSAPVNSSTYPNFTDVKNHKAVFDNININLTGALTQHSPGYFGTSIRISSQASSSIQFGNYVFNNFRVAIDSMDVANHGSSGSSDLIYSGIYNPVTSITFNNPQIYISHFIGNNNPGYSPDISVFRLKNPSSNNKVVINNAYISAQASVTSGHTMALHGAKIEGVNTNVDINGFKLDYGNVGSGITAYGTTVAYDGSGSNIGVNLQNLYIASSATSMTGVKLFASSPIAYLNVSNSNFLNNTGTDIDLSSASTNLAYYTATNNALHTSSLYGNYATGDLPYRDATGRTNRLPIGSSNYFLSVSGGLPAWTNLFGTSNLWSVPQTIQSSTAPQLYINYDASHSINFSVASNGVLTINTPSGAQVSSGLGFGGNYSPLYVGSGNGLLTPGDPSYNVLGNSNTRIYVGSRPNGNPALSAGDNFLGFEIGSYAVKTATTGTHPLITSFAYKAPIVTNQGATVTNQVTGYIEGASSSAINTWFNHGYTRVTGLQVDTLTANTVTYLDANKRLASSSVTSTTLGYLDATSSIQTQLNGKLTNPMTTSGDIIYGGTSGAPTRLAGNTSTSTFFLTSTGTGSAANAPSYFDLFNASNTFNGGQFFNGVTLKSNTTLSFYNSGNAFLGTLTGGSITAARAWSMPDFNGTVAMAAQIPYTVLSKTANYTILSGDFNNAYVLDLYVDATSGAVTITMPSVTSGYTIYVTKKDASANAVTINTVLGSNTLTSQYQSRHFQTDGTNWYNH